MDKINLIFLFFLLFQINKCKLRDLLEEEEIKIICSYCQSDFNQTYKNLELINSTKDDDKINDYVIILIESLKNESKNTSDLLNDYVYPRFINPNLVYIILFIITFIIWIVLIILACIDNKKRIFQNLFVNNKYNKILLYFTIIICVLIIVLSFFVLFNIRKTEIYFNSSICSLLRIYLDVRDGDQAKSTHWVGIKKLQEDLTGDNNTVNKLINTINLQENLVKELENNKYEKNTFDEEEKNNNYFSDSYVNSPNSLNEKVYPSYSKKRQEILRNILLEYSLKLKHGIEINEDISLLNKPIKDNPELISKEYLFINNKLDDILTTVQISAEEYLQYIIDYTKYINNIIFPALYTIFLLLILLSLCIIIFIIIHICEIRINSKINNTHKIMMNIFWNFLFFLLILAILSQVIFKVFNIFSIDGSGILQYATSEQNFNSSDSIIFKGAGNVFLKMCFRDDNGDLLSKILSIMDYNSSKIEQLDKIYLEEIIFGSYYEVIKQIQLNVTENLLNNLIAMYNDYSYISYYEDNLLTIEKNCQSDFDELNKFTDYSNPLISYQNSLLNNHTYDVWTSKYSNCYNYKNYKYISNKNDRIDGKKYCLVIDEFDNDIAKNFYLNIKNIKIIYKTVDIIFSEYHQSLRLFEKDNKKLLYNDPTNFIQRTKNYYEDLISIKGDILKGIDYSKQIVELLNKLLGNPSGIDFHVDLFSIMNCWFLKRDLKVFYIEMEKLGNNSYLLLLFNILEIILVIFCILFMLIIVCKYKYKNDENKDGYFGEINSDSFRQYL